MGEYIKPEPLKNRYIAIIDSACDKRTREEIQEGIDWLKKAGFRVLESDYLFDPIPPTREGYKERASLINGLIANNEVGALMCKTGGFGAEQTLKFVDIGLLKKYPKMVCGYSDNTLLLLTLYDKEKIVVFHGPHLISGLQSEVTIEYFNKIFSKEEYPLEIQSESMECWKPGKVKGKIWGGSLSVIIQYLRFNKEANFNDKILFIEEAYEPAEEVIVSLHHLARTGIYQKIKGIVFGRFWFGVLHEKIPEIKKVLLEHLNDIDIPVLYGFRSGHGHDKITIPFGTEVTLDATDKKVIYEEYPFKE